MNVKEITKLIDLWRDIIDISEKTSKEKADKMVGGLMGRLKRTKGSPVVFDVDTFQAHKEIRKKLCRVMPEYAVMISAEPEIMDGYRWTRKDFIELYHEHFRMVVEKLKRHSR